MSNVLVSEYSLMNIGDAIRSKNGGTTTYKPREMAPAILAIETGTLNSGENSYVDDDTLVVDGEGGGGIVPTGTIIIRANGTVDVTNYASANVNVQPLLQTKTVTPTTSQQTVTADSGYGGLSSVTVNQIPSSYIQPSGTLSIDSNGTYDVTNYASATVSVASSGSSKNVQGYLGYATVASTSYTATSVTLTCSKTGTYKVSWMAYRNTTSGTNGTQLYVNGSARGSAQTSWVNSYGQSVVLSDISLSEGDVLVVRARSRSTSYYVGVGNLIIEEQ